MSTVYLVTVKLSGCDGDYQTGSETKMCENLDDIVEDLDEAIASAIKQGSYSMTEMSVDLSISPVTQPAWEKLLLWSTMFLQRRKVRGLGSHVAE
jgi:hypothetical protein